MVVGSAPTFLATQTLEHTRWLGGVGIVLGSAIQGAGASSQTLRLDTLVILLVQVPLCVLAYALEWKATDLWLAVAATYVSFALVYVVSYRHGTFLRQRIE